MLVMGPNENKEKTYYLNDCEKYYNNITYTTILTPNFITYRLLRLLVFNDEWWVYMGRNCPSFIVTKKRKKKKKKANSEIRCAIGCISRIIEIILCKAFFFFFQI